MSDYAVDISTSDYLYMREITITEKSGEDQIDLQVKLILNSFNFNFDFARSDGKDFRLGEKSNGTYILNMWIVSWDATNKKAQIWFKLPRLLANEIKVLYAYWGNSSDFGISDMQSIDFWLADGFDNTIIYNSNWYEYDAGGQVFKYFNDDDPEGHSTLYMSHNTSYIQSSKRSLSSLTSWSIEVGFYIYEETEDIAHSWIYSQRFQFFVPGNDIHYYFARDGSFSGAYGSRTENFQDSAASYPNDYTKHEWGALVKGFSRHVFGYYLPTDRFYFGMYDRDTSEIPTGCPDGYKGDYLDSIERRVGENTDFTYIRIYGRYFVGLFSATPNYFDWVIIRDNFLGPYEPEFDTSNLYVQYEQVDDDPFAYDYGSDVTNIGFEHTTSSGGDPTHLSDNYLPIIWCSDPDAAEDSVDLTINFGIWVINLVSDGYLHYDSGHVLYYNAAKLSDEDEDINNNNYWQGTTTSGWACIDFGSNINNVGVIGIKSVTSNLAGTVKNYKIEGSYTYTNNWEDEHWKVLDEGQFNQSTDWQSAIFVNGTKYRFYRLKVLDTYGDNIALQEWRMFNYNQDLGKKVVSVLKLKPDSSDSNFIYFPKQITFYGSNDGASWVTFINAKNTYTPDGAGWQEYSFTNTIPYYHYKLTCVGNWNDNSGKICIAEWSMHERNIEVYTYRVLAGTNDNYNSVWARLECGFDSGEFYVVNDAISVVNDDTLSRSISITGDVRDLNVI